MDHLLQDSPATVQEWARKAHELEANKKRHVDPDEHVWVLQKRDLQHTPRPPHPLNEVLRTVNDRINRDYGYHKRDLRVTFGVCEHDGLITHREWIRAVREGLRIPARELNSFDLAVAFSAVDVYDCGIAPRYDMACFFRLAWHVQENHAFDVAANHSRKLAQDAVGGGAGFRSACTEGSHDAQLRRGREQSGSMTRLVDSLLEAAGSSLSPQAPSALDITADKILATARRVASSVKRGEDGGMSMEGLMAAMAGTELSSEEFMASWLLSNMARGDREDEGELLTLDQIEATIRAYLTANKDHVSRLYENLPVITFVCDRINEMIARQYRDVETGFQQLYRATDQDGSGGVDVSEFAACIRKTLRLAPSLCSEADIDILFSAVDVTRDGEISFDELSGFLRHRWNTHAASRGGRTSSAPPRAKAAQRKPVRMHEITVVPSQLNVPGIYGNMERALATNDVRLLDLEARCRSRLHRQAAFERPPL